MIKLGRGVEILTREVRSSILIENVQIFGKVKDITSYQHPGCYRGWVIARFGLQCNIYSDTKLWYETELLIGHTHILF